MSYIGWGIIAFLGAGCNEEIVRLKPDLLRGDGCREEIVGLKPDLLQRGGCKEEIVRLKPDLLRGDGCREEIVGLKPDLLQRGGCKEEIVRLKPDLLRGDGCREEIVRLKPDLLRSGIIAFSRDRQGHGDAMSVKHSAAVVGMNDVQAPTGSRSRFNAVKHGLTAKTAVLPGEDPAELQCAD